MNIKRAVSACGAVALAAFLASEAATAKMLAGDFNGDGHTDIVDVYDDQGIGASMKVRLNNAGMGLGAPSNWANMQGVYSDNQRWMTGDFNGDGKTDVAKAYSNNGLINIRVHVSDGVSHFTEQVWPTGACGFDTNQKWLTGDFNGDGLADIAVVHKEDSKNSIDVHVSTGSSFVCTRWSTKLGGFNVDHKWLAGDFNGDGYTDLVNVYKDNGNATMNVRLSTGSSFVNNVTNWATRQGGFSDSQQWVAGDFNADGLTDLAKAFNDDDLVSFDVHLSSGTSFSMQRWGTRQGGFGNDQTWMAGKFSPDHPGHDMLVTYFKYGAQQGGVRKSNGTSFSAGDTWLPYCANQTRDHYRGSYAGAWQLFSPSIDNGPVGWNGNNTRYHFGGTLYLYVIQDSLSPTPVLWWGDFGRPSGDIFLRDPNFTLPFWYTENYQVCE